MRFRGQGAAGGPRNRAGRVDDPQGSSPADPALSPSGGSSTNNIHQASDGPVSRAASELRSWSRASAERAEAQHELLRLRTRYWSGERLLEEAKTDLEWWEHPEADPHAVLELLPGASMEEASAARRRIARRCHPDLMQLQGERRELALRHMVAANAAYDRLRRALRPV